MTRSEEQELLELTRQNNQLLQLVLAAVRHDEGNDFIHNIIANLVANKMEGNTYGQQQSQFNKSGY